MSNQTFLAFDFGMVKIGVAIGQSVTLTAQPLSILKVRDGIPNWEQVQQIITEWSPNGLVVGIPCQLDYREQEITFAARKFAERLKTRYHLPVYYADERLTTKEARSLSRDSGLVDHYAAALILESWLREHFHDAT